MPKYSKGDEVVIRCTIAEVYDSDDWYSEDRVESNGYEVHPTLNKAQYKDTLSVDEIWIEGLAPVVEPTRVGTVVVVNGIARILSSVDNLWRDDATYGVSWEEFVVGGTPKVVYAPES